MGWVFLYAPELWTLEDRIIAPFSSPARVRGRLERCVLS